MEEFWLDIFPVKGEGDAVITNTVKSYAGRGKRNTVVVAAAETVSAIDSYTVQQNPHDEYVIISRRVIEVQSSENIVTITGRSNARKITFAAIVGGEINFIISDSYIANGYGAINGQPIQDDPGGKAEYNFEFKITVPRNTGYARSGEVLVSGENSSTVVVINQSIYELTVFFTAGSYVTSVTPTSQKIEYGGSISCVATFSANTPQHTYTFDAWYKNGVKFSTNPILEASNVTSSETYEAAAYRTLNSYSLTVTPSPILGGTVTGGGTYYYGTKVTTTAVAAATYRFTKWVGDNGVESTLNPFNSGWNILGNINVTAVFSKITYQLILRNTSKFEPDGDYVENTDGGIVTGAGIYEINTSVFCTATPKAGYQFDGWYDVNGALLNSNASFTIIMNDLKIFVARFSQKWVDLTVTSNIVKFNGSDAETWQLDGASGQFNPVIDVVLGSYHYHEFYYLKKIVPFGATITLTCDLNSGYRFFGYYDYVDELNVTLVTKVDGLVMNNYTAHRKLVARVVPSAGFIVEFTYDNETTIPPTTPIFAYVLPNSLWNKYYSISAETPNYSFPISELVSGTAELTSGTPTAVSCQYGFMNVESDSVVKFSAPWTVYNVVPMIWNGSVESITPSGPTNVRYGDSITCNCVPLPEDDLYRYTFDSWTVRLGGGPLDTIYEQEFVLSPTFSFPPHYTDLIVSVNARGGRYPKLYSIVVVNGSGSGDNFFNSEVIITAYNYANREFTRWNDGNTESPRTIIVKGDATYTAEFKTKVFLVTCYSVYDSEVTVYPVAQEIGYGSTGTMVRATPSAGYAIEKWVNHATGATVSTSDTFTPTNVTEDAIYFVYTVKTAFMITVHFEANNEDPLNQPISYHAQSGQGTVTITPPEVTSGGSSVLKAIPEPGYDFAEWYNSTTGVVLSTSPTFTFTNILESDVIKARFQKKWFDVNWGYANVWDRSSAPYEGDMCLYHLSTGSLDFTLAGFSEQVGGAYMYVTHNNLARWVRLDQVTDPIIEIKFAGERCFAFTGTDIIWHCDVNDYNNWSLIEIEHGFIIADVCYGLGMYVFVTNNPTENISRIDVTPDLTNSSNVYSMLGGDFAGVAFNGTVFLASPNSGTPYYTSVNSYIWEAHDATYTVGRVFSFSNIFASCFNGHILYNENGDSGFTSVLDVEQGDYKILTNTDYGGFYTLNQLYTSNNGMDWFPVQVYNAKALALRGGNVLEYGYPAIEVGLYYGKQLDSLRPVNGFIGINGFTGRVIYGGTTPIQTIAALNSEYNVPQWNLISGNATLRMLNNNLSMTLSGVTSNVYYTMGFTEYYGT